MKLCALVFELHLPQNLCHTQTDRQFPEIVKSCSGLPKLCKSIQNWKSKICTKPILSSIYIEERINLELNVPPMQNYKKKNIYKSEIKI